MAGTRQKRTISCRRVLATPFPEEERRGKARPPGGTTRRELGGKAQLRGSRGLWGSCASSSLSGKGLPEEGARLLWTTQGAGVGEP